LDLERPSSGIVQQAASRGPLAAAAAALTNLLRPKLGSVSSLPSNRIGVTIADLQVNYGRRTALEGVSGSFAPGSLTAVVGPNGAGKSSLLKAIAGLHLPRAGAITYSHPLRCSLAYLPQQSDVDREYPVSVEELVALGAWRSMGPFRALSQASRPAIDGAIAQVGLEGLAGRQIGELSVGQLRRALFARLIVQDCFLILLDEPFAGVDEETTAELLRLIQTWHREQRTVIAVMHDLEVVRRCFPETLLLARRCLSWGDTGTTLSPDNWAAANRAMRTEFRSTHGSIR
jgi:zinc/manganese transport system ATP-binding protein